MITILIITVTSLFSIIAFSNKSLLSKGIFNAYAVWQQNQWSRLFTYGLLHANWEHLIVNMLTLYFFGPIVEGEFFIRAGILGKWFFLFFYIFALPISTFADLIKYKDTPYYFALGASGAVSAVLFAAILIAPTSTLFVFFIIPMKAWIFGILYLLYSYYMSNRNIDNIGHSAHFWGAVFGFVFPVLFYPDLIVKFFAQLF